MQHPAARHLSRRRLLRLAVSGTASLLAGCNAPVRAAARAASDYASRTAAAWRPALAVRRPLWVLLRQEIYPDHNLLINSQVQSICEERGWNVKLGTLAELAGSGARLGRLVAAVQSGNPPDLVLHSLPVVRLHALGCLQPVTDLVDEVQTAWGAAAARPTLESRFGGEWYAVPFVQRSEGGWYRADLWQAANIDIAGLRTYPELLEASLEFASRGTDVAPWGVAASPCADGEYLAQRVICGWGGQWQDASGQFATIATPETMEALAWLMVVYTGSRFERAIPSDIRRWTDPSNDEAYWRGRIAYTQSSGALLTQPAVSATSQLVAAMTAYHPQAGGPRVREFNGLGASSWLIPRGARNDSQARDVVRSLMVDGDRMDRVFATAPALALPAYPGYWERSPFLASNGLAQQQKVVACDPQGTVPWLFPGPNTPAMYAARSAGICTDLLRSVLGGTLPVEALQAARDHMVAIFQEHGLPGRM